MLRMVDDLQGKAMHRISIVAVFVSTVLLSSVGARAQGSAQDTPVVPPSPVPPVAAQPQNPAVPPPAMAANPNNVSDPLVTQDLDQVICVNEKLTGSMLPSRVCQTRRAWSKHGVNSREVSSHAQNVGSGQPGGN